MKKIAQIAMSAKPYTLGHDGLVRLASKECDEVHLHVSLSDRVRPGEVAVLGSDMQKIWKMIEQILPGNVIVSYGGSPVANIYKELGEANETHSDDMFVIYADPTDLQQNFKENSLVKYADSLFEQGKIKLRAVMRTETTDISGTKMRKYIQDGDEQKFIQGLPKSLDGKKIWKMLSASAKAYVPKKLAPKKVKQSKKSATIESIVHNVMLKLLNESQK